MKLPWYKRLLQAIGIGLKKAAKALYEIVAPAVKASAIAWINDPDHQAAALLAVQAAAAGNLKGRDAFNHARAVFREIMQDAAANIAANWIDTIVQTAYFTHANSEESNA
jgi:hypothetical protein